MEDNKLSSAPNFTLEDFMGQEVTLSNYKGDKNIVLVFNRGFL
jgi:peroxiredoxin